MRFPKDGDLQTTSFYFLGSPRISRPVHLASLSLATGLSGSSIVTALIFGGCLQIGKGHQKPSTRSLGFRMR